MKPAIKDTTSSEELFRRESIRAASTQELARARIARPWGVVLVATLSLPLLTGLVAFLTCYSYEQAFYAEGSVQKTANVTCGDSRQRDLVGVLVVDELRLRHLQEGTAVPVQFPAISRANTRSTVLCISESHISTRSLGLGTRFDVILGLDGLKGLEHDQPIRAGMSLRAVTHRSSMKLMTLFTKEGNDGR